MILRFFRSDSILVLFVMVLSGIGLAFPLSESSYQPLMLFFNDTFVSFTTRYGILSAIVGSLLIITQAFYLSRLNYKYIFIEGATYLPSFLYVLFSSIFYFLSGLNNALIANFFILFAIDRYFVSDKGGLYIGNYFEGSFLFFLAFIIYPGLIFIYPFFLLIIIVLRPFNWREWITGFLGFFVPLIFLATVFFTFDIPFDYSVFLQLINGNDNYYPAVSPGWYVLIFPSAILTGAMLFSLYRQNVRKIVTSKYFRLFIFLVIYLFLLNYFLPGYSAGYIYLFNLPSSFLVGYLFCTIRPGRWANFLFILFILSLVVIRYVYLIFPA